jgi:hypothetical protein
MSRCPVCESFHILVRISVRPRASCDTCGARWIQQGSRQKSIKQGPLSRLIGEAVRYPGINLLSGRVVAPQLR